MIPIEVQGLCGELRSAESGFTIRSPDVIEVLGSENGIILHKGEGKANQLSRLQGRYGRIIPEGIEKGPVRLRELEDRLLLAPEIIGEEF